VTAIVEFATRPTHGTPPLACAAIAARSAARPAGADARVTRLAGQAARKRQSALCLHAKGI